MGSSVLIPWFTLREVPIEVEIVSCLWLFYFIYLPPSPPPPPPPPLFFSFFFFLFPPPSFSNQKSTNISSQPSPKVAVLRFNRGMQQGLLGRISRTSIMEYHAFGIISEGRKASCHYMICGVQGDFTKDLVANPPKTVWTRELKFGKVVRWIPQNGHLLMYALLRLAGVGHASAMFKRGIRICTGTGIGAALSTCIQSPNW